MFPDNTAKVLLRMSAALIPGAPVSFTVWKTAGMWVLMHKAAILARCDPTIPPPNFYHPSWNHPETLIGHLERAGFQDIQISDRNIPWRVENKSAFVRRTAGTPMWKEYVKDWTPEQREKVSDCILEVLDEEYPDAAHGPIDVPMIGYIAFARNSSG
jgi:hypothetical protein